VRNVADQQRCEGSVDFAPVTACARELSHPLGTDDLAQGRVDAGCHPLHAPADIDGRTTVDPLAHLIVGLEQAVLDVDPLLLVAREHHDPLQDALEAPRFDLVAAEEVVLRITFTEDQPVVLLARRCPCTKMTSKAGQPRPVADEDQGSCRIAVESELRCDRIRNSTVFPITSVEVNSPEPAPTVPSGRRSWRTRSCSSPLVHTESIE
jgi:hypothetical protein